MTRNWKLGVCCIASALLTLTVQAQTQGPFMGLKATDEPQLLAPDLIAQPFVEYNGTFSADGTLFFYTTQMPGTGVISYTEMTADGSWTAPRAAPFKSNFPEYDPLFSPDGKRLYFSSERTVNEGDEGGQSNIWYVDRQGDGWSDPVNIPLTEDADYFSSVTKTGIIYFNVWNEGDIFRAIPGEDGYEVERLPDVINGGEFNVGDPFISPDEDYIIYRGYAKERRAGEIFISFNQNGTWTTPQNLGEPINSKQHEMTPYVTTDGKIFIWASARLLEPYSLKAGELVSNQLDKQCSPDNGQLNIYYIKADFIEKLRPKK